jgi:dTDP-4-dehydrorhamnose reductase
MILIFGKTGQVAVELSKFKDVVCIGREVSDLEIPKSCETAIYKYNPKVVINAAAYTAVDEAENNETLAYKINSEAPALMATTCNVLCIPFIHISTEYVFNGKNQNPWLTNDKTAPLCVYGHSKRNGELAILNANSNAIILRTSWIFSATGKNFLKTILELSKKNSELSIVSDQVGGPTSAQSIARVCYKIANSLIYDKNNISKSGIYHFSGMPFVSWADFAEEIIINTNFKTVVNKIRSSEYNTLAKRPLNSRLDSSRLKEDFNELSSDWKKDLRIVLKELGELAP